MTAISIDCRDSSGTLRAIHGTNAGPLYLQGAYDASEHFRQAGFATVRLHDCPYSCFDVVDIPNIFPLFHLDPDDPRHYVFRPTDSYIQSILDCGCGIVYRLGVSIRKRPEFSLATRPPEDVDKWGRVCSRIIRHYNDGWADGFHHDIRYWEIWNEADNGPTQWDGTYDEFIEFFITAAKRIKADCPGILIGGPSFNGSFRHSRDKLHTFLPRLKAAGCPLDFLSWHAYIERPSELLVAARDVRAILDDYGFTHTENHCNEWNLAPATSFKEMRRTPQTQKAFFAYKDGPVGAAMAAACLVALQDAPMDMTNYYSSLNLNYGMFESLGIPKKPYFAFPAFNDLLTTCPDRLAVTGSDPDSGLAVLAGMARDGTSIGLYTANYGSETRNWRLELNGLPWNEPKVEARVIDGDRDLEPCTETATVRGNLLDLRAPRHTVALVTLRPG
jgi:hypothetical protein